MLIVKRAVTARPESFEILLEASLEHVARSRQECGCLSHAVHLDCEDPLKLVFIEEWADRDALLAHLRQPGRDMFMSTIRELAEAPLPPLKVLETAFVVLPPGVVEADAQPGGLRRIDQDFVAQPAFP
jgi:quinol monooxygenase YgiN